MERSNRVAAGLLVLLTILVALVTYKGAAALATLEQARHNRAIPVSAGIVPLQDGSGAHPLSRTLNYLSVVWPALAFGILLGAAVRALVSGAQVGALFGGGRLRAQLAAGAAGVPLMLCSCCVAPLFSSVYERSARLGPSLALMIAAPSLNPAALILTFVLFSFDIAAARLVMSLVAVLAGTAVVARLWGRPTGAGLVLAATGAAEEGTAGAQVVRRFLGAAGHMIVRTVPLLVLGVAAGMIVAEYLPSAAFTSPSSRITTIAVIAAVAVPIALPTFFEVPLAVAVLAAGAPAGAAAALLFAGPAVNLPSLLTVAHVTGPRVAAAVAAMVWLVALLGGLLVG